MNLLTVRLHQSLLDFTKYATLLGKNSFKIGREMICLDSFTRINLRSTYEGPQISEKKRAVISKYQTHYIPYRGQEQKLTHSDLILLDTKEFMERQFGENTLVHILPHFQRPDILYCFDDTGKSVTNQILDCLPSHYSGEIISKESIFSKRPEMADNMDKYRMIAVVQGGWNLYLRGTDKMTGELQMKMEQLEMIGYNPILIHWNEWSKMTLIEKERFLDEKIRKALSG